MVIKFLLNRQLSTEQQLDPNTTVLQYLRSNAAKTGTKEGCASGDCGACTAVVAHLEGDQLRYNSINTCLTFISALHGKQLITVEDLQQGAQLHKSQQAMLECHGSQCGFCTPGFVMSMFALGKNVAKANEQDIHRALGGNLCRCTGYRPIVDAAKQMYQDDSVDQFEQSEAAVISQLKALQQNDVPTIECREHKAFNPRTIAELISLLETYPDAQLVAGGTDLALQVTQFHRPIAQLISLCDISELQQVNVTASNIEFGAALSLTKCEAVLSTEYPDFVALLQRFASLQIRNQGTMGGNIANASPIGDTPPVLLALDAKLELCSLTGTRTIPLSDYFIDYKVTALQAGEFISKIIVPRADAHTALRCYKLSKRMEDDISAVLGCFDLTIEQGLIVDARIAFGGMAAIPKRALRCEAILRGKPWCMASIDLAKVALAEEFNPLSDFRASSAYRMLSAQNMLTRYFIELTSPEIATRVADHV